MGAPNPITVPNQNLLIPETPPLTPVADQAFPPPANAGVQAETFPTPVEDFVIGQEPPPGARVSAVYVPASPNIDVGQQNLANALNTADFTVTEAGSIQTNLSTATDLPGFVVASVTPLPLASPPRYRLTLVQPDFSPANLVNLGVSLAGRSMTFDEDTVTAADAGVERTILLYGVDFVEVAADEFGDTLFPPISGDSLTIDNTREASEPVFVQRGITANVNISTSTPPQSFRPNPPQAQAAQEDLNTSTGAQPNNPVIPSGVQVPTAINVNVADQATSNGLPANVYV
jgi:hypothetical protein